MKRTIARLLIVLFCGIIINVPSFAQDRAKKKVAVYMTGSTSNEAYKKVIGAKLVSAITESGEYAAVERTADFLAALSAESDYQTSGEVRDSQIAQLGQKFGVRFVVVADVNELFDECFITARMINVESGLVERAYDINGAADSMNQLISLSQKVAKGLLGAGESFNNSDLQSTPTNMSLCAVKGGKVFFITPLQWQQMQEVEKITYNKKGVCLMDNGNIIIIAMQDSGNGNQYKARELKAPTLFQLKIMYNNLVALNTALRIFGGEPLNNESTGDVGYVASDYSTDASKGYRLEMSNGNYRESTWNDSWVGNRIRTVYNLNEIIQEASMMWK